MNTQNKDILDSQDDYKYDFKDRDVTIFNTGKGLSEDVIRAISAAKNEPEWMLELRLKAYHKFLEFPLPSFGPDLSDIDFNDFTYYKKP
ncbi:MAG: Fe-S cluster assembly protein SufB, partial [Erysipelotrichaceae bacterium]|nr:Fe-S cluster assembly protein SufB [Erysipelotrichaceae bacterium]